MKLAPWTLGNDGSNVSKSTSKAFLLVKVVQLLQIQSRILYIYIITIQSIQDHMKGRDIHDAMNIMHIYIYFRHLYTLAEPIISLGPLRYVTYVTIYRRVSFPVAQALLFWRSQWQLDWTIQAMLPETGDQWAIGIVSIEVKRSEDENERSSVPKQWAEALLKTTFVNEINHDLISL